jgi:putative membrane protein
MGKALIRWFVLTVAVWLAAVLVPGIHYDSFGSVAAAALVLGILNAFVKPAMQVLSFPFIVLSFGLFLLVINAFLLKLSAWFVEGFDVSGFWPAVMGSLIVSLVSFFLGWPHQEKGVFIVSTRRTLQGRHRPPGDGPVIDV